MARHSAHDLLMKEHFRVPSQLWEKRNSKISPAYPHFTQKVAKEPLWVDGLYNPSWVGEELRRTEPARVSGGEPNEKDEGTAFVALLRACAKNKDLCRGSRVHHDILRRGLQEKCSDALVTMYAKCGALAKAKELFDIHKSRDVFTWNTLIAGYAQTGQGQDALNYFEKMQHEGLSPDAVTYVSILKVYASTGAADKGEQIHDEIAKKGLLGKRVVLGNALVNMYAKCGAFAKAQQVLEELPIRNVVSWNALIGGYAHHGEGDKAFNCFEQMQREGLSPNAVTFISVLKACGSIGAAAADKGEQIHDEIAKQGLLRSNIALGNALVDMYAKCGALAKARRMLEELPVRNVISWSALITGYAREGEGEQALKCFEQMQCEGLSPNAVTFVCILRACGSIGATDKGEQIHEEIAKQGLLANNIILGNALVNMYAKCGALAKARRLLEELPVRNVVSWNALIAGYAQHGEGEQALNCFEGMQREGLSPNAVTFICILKACGSIGAADKGEQIHDEIARQGLLRNDIVLGTALVDMYAQCGALAKARQVLEELPTRNVISWNTLIARSVQQGEGEQALNCFEQMQREGLDPDASTFSCVLSACSRLGLVEDAQMHFVNITKRYGMKPAFEHYNCMVNLFGRVGHLDKAVGVIEKMPSSNSGVWYALLGFCRKWGDVNVGRWAFEHAVQFDKSDGPVNAPDMQEHVDSNESMHQAIMFMGS